MDEKTLLNALDISDQPFSVTVRGPSKRRKQRGPQSQLVQQDLWQKRLSVAYEVTPSQLWSALRTYKRFTGTMTSETNTFRPLNKSQLEMRAYRMENAYS